MQIFWIIARSSVRSAGKRWVTAFICSEIAIMYDFKWFLVRTKDSRIEILED